MHINKITYKFIKYKGGKYFHIEKGCEGGAGSSGEFNK